MKKFSLITLCLMISLSLAGMASSAPDTKFSEKEAIKKLAKATLRHLEIAFESENLNDFLEHVSDPYLPQQLPELKQTLIRRFDSVNQIYVKIIVDSYVINLQKQRVAIRTHWKRRWVVSGASAPTRAEGNTTFYFEIQNHSGKLIDMKGDILFG